MIDPGFWKGKQVFITGHTGFKGSWLCLWLHSLGAEITGFSLSPPTVPSLFSLCKIEDWTTTITGDIRNRAQLNEALHKADPDIIIHMAAQPLVRVSYENPVETYEINVIGTLNVFEAVRTLLNNNKPRAIINVTSDKCYDNKEWVWGYRETEAMGGHDPYSNSKGCSELITASYRNSFFNPQTYETHRVALASARAGNVIGGGDWAKDRLVPDCIHCLLNGEKMQIRNPMSIRPWQHVLEPLGGYLVLAQKLYTDGVQFAEGWNFGPNEEDAKPVQWIVESLYNKWGTAVEFTLEEDCKWHEAHYLKLDCAKAKNKLGWKPRWNLDHALNKIIQWTRGYNKGKDIKKLCLEQIKEYGQ
ncbi:MAG TPA: CDP-glucose 4,6-dehydratase [Paenibacillaceae bacterium]|nr:CDP-glucose 4,6-dehydratase [Paenibacillaceae bacterium]